MSSQYKLIFRDEAGHNASLTLPNHLIEGRRELWRAAFRDATARVQQELQVVPAERLDAFLQHACEVHRSYFNEYLDVAGVQPSGELLDAERAWVSTLDEKVLRIIGQGDVTTGREEVILAICTIVDDDMQPLKRAPFSPGSV